MRLEGRQNLCERERADVPVEPAKSQYRQVADLLRSAVESREYPPGSALPSEGDLAREFAVSRVTVNRAVQLLRAEGLVRVLRGRGTVVRASRPIDRHANLRYRRAGREAEGNRGAFDFEIRRLGLVPSTTLTELGATDPPEGARESLGLAPGEQVLVRRREMFASDEPLVLAVSYYPWALAERAGLTAADSGPGGSYSRLADIGMGPVRFSETVRVRVPSASEERFFALSETQPVYEVTHVSRAADGDAVEHRVDVLPTHQWVLRFEWDVEDVP